MNLAQKMMSLTGAPRVSMLGSLNLLISTGRPSRLLRKYSSHLAVLILSPRGGPSRWMAWLIADFGPARVPSSRFQQLNVSPEHSAAPAMDWTSLCSTKENRRGPSGSPCWSVRGTLWSRVHVGSSVLGVPYGVGYMWGVVC